LNFAKENGVGEEPKCMIDELPRRPPPPPSKKKNLNSSLMGLAYQGKYIIVFRFIMEL
jgi:hypothetical protein